jgi:hypothetical protein
MKSIGPGECVPDSADLLAVARLLLKSAGAEPASEAALRRAVSTAYYAVFHHLLRAAVRRFVGPAGEASAAYGILYRGFDHRRIREVCEALDSERLSPRYTSKLRRTAMSKEIRDFSDAFPTIQEQRQLADYDPAASFIPAQVATLIDEVEVAISSFDRADPQEQADVLALMLVGTRG